MPRHVMRRPNNEAAKLSKYKNGTSKVTKISIQDCAMISSREDGTASVTPITRRAPRTAARRRGNTKRVTTCDDGRDSMARLNATSRPRRRVKQKRKCVAKAETHILGR